MFYCISSLYYVCVLLDVDDGVGLSPVHFIHEGPLLFSCEGERSHACPLGFVRYPLIYIGDIQDEPDLVSEMGQVPRDDIVEDVRTGVAQVYVVLNCRSADEHLYLATAQTYERFLLPGERVKNDESAPQEK